MCSSALWIPAVTGIVTAVAVAIQTSVFIAQARLIRRQLAAQQYAEYTRRYGSITERFQEAVNDPSFDFDKLPISEQQALMRPMRAYFDLCYEEWQLNEWKWIEPSVWEVWTGGISTAMSRPAFRQAWAKVRSSASYPPGFEADIDGRAK